MFKSLKSLRTKFILAVGLPLLLYFGVVIFMENLYGTQAARGIEEAYMTESTNNLAMQINEVFVKNAQIAVNNASYLKSFPFLMDGTQHFKNALFQILQTPMQDNPELAGAAIALLPPAQREHETQVPDTFICPRTSPYVWRDGENSNTFRYADLTQPPLNAQPPQQAQSTESVLTSASDEKLPLLSKSDNSPASGDPAISDVPPESLPNGEQPSHRPQNPANSQIQPKLPPRSDRGPDQPNRDLSSCDRYFREDHWKNLDWYATPYQTGKPGWTEPYEEPFGKDQEMVTYSVPVLIDEQLRAICTIDISLDHLRQKLREFPVAKGFLVVITSEGTVVVHPHFTRVVSAQEATKDTIDTLNAQKNANVSVHAQAMAPCPRAALDPTSQQQLKALRKRIQTLEAGTERIWDPCTQQYYWTVCSPIKSIGWTLIHVLPEAEALASVSQAFHRLTTVFVFILITTLLIVSVTAAYLTRQLEPMDKAAEKIIAGDFSVRLEDNHQNDEIGRLSKTFNHMLTVLDQTVDQKAQEEAARQMIEADVRKAREIQTRMLPNDACIANHNEFNVWGLNYPARYVAGDFYDYWFLDDETLAFLVADVSGKGTPAAMFMAMTRATLRGASMAERSPAETLRQVNEILNQSNDQMFVTIFYGHYNIKTGKMVYANGGHLPPILQRAKDGQTETVKLPFGYPVGIIPHAKYDQSELALEPGDTLCIYTDGITEATSSEKNGDKVLFGVERLACAVHEHRNMTPPELCQTLAQTADSFRNSERQDDITVVVLKRCDTEQTRAGR